MEGGVADQHDQIRRQQAESDDNHLKTMQLTLKGEVVISISEHLLC